MNWVKKQDWAYYFDLHCDYDEIDEFLVSKYPKFEDAIKFSKGIRILNQAHLETIITFIISANNNIKRISVSVNEICAKYSKLIYSSDKRVLRLFS